MPPELPPERAHERVAEGAAPLADGAAPLAEGAALRLEALLGAVLADARAKAGAGIGASAWSDEALAAAARKLGFDDGELRRLAPDGARDLIALWFAKADQAAADHLRAPEMAALKIREKVRSGVIAWLSALVVAEDATGEGARTAVARSAFTCLMARGRVDQLGKIHWRAADAIWTGLGDRSLDGNYYSKRAILAGVLAATIPVWIAAEDDAAAFAFLDRRIAGIMRFEKFKADTRILTAKWPNPAELLSRLRYPGR